MDGTAGCNPVQVFPSRGHQPFHALSQRNVFHLRLHLGDIHLRAPQLVSPLAARYNACPPDVCCSQRANRTAGRGVWDADRVEHLNSLFLRWLLKEKLVLDAIVGGLLVVDQGPPPLSWLLFLAPPLCQRRLPPAPAGALLAH